MLHPAQLSLHVVALQALSNVQPATQQVQVCTFEAKGASQHSPLGSMASGSHPSPTGVATRPHAAAVDVSRRQAPEGDVSSTQAPCTVQPATQQVQVCTSEAKGASPHLPVGSMASGSHPPLAEVGSMSHAAPVEEVSRQAPCTAPVEDVSRQAPSTAPVGEVRRQEPCTVQPATQQAEVATRPQTATEVDVCKKQATQPSQMLDKCLARASLAAEKLDRMSALQAGVGKPVSGKAHSTKKDCLGPGAKLDIVIAQASSLLGKLDKLTLAAATQTWATGDIDTAPEGADSKPPPRQGQVSISEAK